MAYMTAETSVPSLSSMIADTPDADKYSVCVHCGFCLEVCPTYQELFDENQSPRGRVYLIKEVAEGRLSLDAAVIDPVYTCLDCRACETVCPSGVQVGALIEETRGQAHAAQLPHGVNDRLERLFLRHIFPYPVRLYAIGGLLKVYQRAGLRWLLRRLGLLRILPQHVQEMEAVLPAVKARPALQTLPPRMAAQGVRKATAALFTGCVMDVFFASINEATARVAVRNGLEVVVPKQQLCCGALQIHAGDRQQARELARQNVDAFLATGAEYVIVNAAGCGAALKEYPELFRDDPEYHSKAEEFSGRVRDISELLVEVGFEAPTGRVDHVITYHDACHLCHAQNIRDQPRRILRSIPGLKVVDMQDSERCCGGAGSYNLTHPQMAGQLLERKMDDVPEGVSAIAMGNPGCMLQIKVGAHRRHQDIDVLHTVELLDMAYAKEAR